MRFCRFAVAALAAVALSCVADSPTSPSGDGTDDCSTRGRVTYVRDVLRDWYYWYEQLPDPDVSGFDSAEAYLDAVRFKEKDTSYSYVTSKASSEAFYSASQYIGFGFSYRETSATTIRMTQTFPDGPAAEAGMDRGDTLLSVNGKPVADLLRSGEFGSVFGPEQEGVKVDVTWRDLRSVEHGASLVKRKVTIPTVSQTAVLNAGGTRVGYIHFRNFVEPSKAALDAAFTRLRDEHVAELVLDLRYNGGGLVSVAQHLAALIAGKPVVGKVFVTFSHNDKQKSRDDSLRFESLSPALELRRLVVIQTRGTASASEAIVNGLRPYIEVKTVGDTSYGKPVGQYGFEFCDQVLYPVAFLVTNARGQADYFGGIPADCAAGDDLDHALASPSEASLAEALHVARFGGCSGTAAAATLRARSRGETPRPRGDGWQLLLNAR